MNVMKARSLALQAKSNIGRLLRLCKEARRDPSNSRELRDLTRQLKHQQYDLNRLYGMHPEIGPIKVRQLNLFSVARQAEERKISCPKGWDLVGCLPGEGKTYSLPVCPEQFPEEPIPMQDPADLFLMSMEV